ncbi:MAG: M24B family metallopeptidase, partial [Bacteroidota bacterium]|nr:M24B family metallopeptidase [Bacteroidota bacterium]
RLEKLLKVPAEKINDSASVDLIKAVAAQRSVKSEEEIAEIEKALDISYVMVTEAMKSVREGKYEREIAGMAEGIALSMGSGLSFPTIFSVHGEILHNHSYDNIMKNGQLIVFDSGAESILHYASDITRTIPVSGKFTQRQREVYEIVLKANVECAKAVRPGIMHKEVHMKAAQIITDGLKTLGLLKGNTEDIIASGAHALFFPHGLGHLLGLDVHDLENLGEIYTGYDETIERSKQFGLSALRYGKMLKPGLVLTDEPGVYFIPALISKWESENKCREFIDYEKAKSYIGFGGIRVEDDVLVTETGGRILGKPIPKTVEEIESLMSGK